MIPVCDYVNRTSGPTFDIPPLTLKPLGHFLRHECCEGWISIILKGYITLKLDHL